MEISYLLLIITCVLYGMTQFVESWEDFGLKLINILVFIAVFVLTILTAEDGFFQDHAYWLNYILPIPAVYVGHLIGSGIDDDDWTGIFVILSIIGLIATIIATCCEI